MAFPIVGAIAGGVGLLGGIASRNKTAGMQDAAINAWYNYQNKAKDKTDALVDANREANYGTLGNLLSGSTLEARQGVIDGETDRLYNASLADDFTGPGQTSFEARKIAEATQQAREMIKAQARTRAYGDSFGGMGSERRLAFGVAVPEIGMSNERSSIDLGVLQKKQQVQPVMYQHQSTGLGDLLTSYGFGQVGNWLGGLGASGPIAQSAWTPTTRPMVTNDAYRAPGYGKF